MKKLKKIRNENLFFNTYDDFDKFCMGKDVQRCHVTIDEYLSDEEYCKRYKALSANIKTGKIINYLPN